MKLNEFGVNAGYLVELYERYLQHPESVDLATGKVFGTWTPADWSATTPASLPQTANLDVIVGAANLAEWRSILVEPLNDPRVGPGFLRVTTALRDDNARILAALRELL